jgi:type IV secretory pathway VirJ component
VVLLGYSQGADVLPFIFNRLPVNTQSAIVNVVALSIGTTATFEFHVRNWVGASGDRPTLPEVQRLAHGPFLCVYGKEDGDALCPALEPSAFRSVQLPGGHHFNGDDDRLSTIVLNALPPD